MMGYPYLPAPVLKAEQAGSKDENGLHLSPPPSRGEGKGGGEYSDPVPLTSILSHRGERRCFVKLFSI
jgi:hypothetical protein